MLNSMNTKLSSSDITLSKGYGPSFAAREYTQTDEEYAKQLDPMVCKWYNMTIPFTASNVNGDRSLFAVFAPWNEYG